MKFSDKVYPTEGRDPSHMVGPGAHETHGVVRDNWLIAGGLEEGYPITDELWHDSTHSKYTWLGLFADGYEKETFSIFENMNNGRLTEHFFIDDEGSGAKSLPRAKFEFCTFQGKKCYR